MGSQNPIPLKKMNATKGSEVSSGSGANIPYIPASTHLPEITIKSFILGAFLAAVMGAANAYLGLKVGITVSACIPAAVISMTVLRAFRESNILENNIVQTTASAGETLAAAAVFTLPALVMMGYWDHFPFWTTSLILILGGLLGVLITIPLRNALVVDSPLKYPEGVAAAEVLLAGDGAVAGGTKQLVMGGLGAALVKMGQSGWQFLSTESHGWTTVGKTVLGFGIGYPVVLMGAGYIVGLEITAASMIGAVLGWGIGVPGYGLIFGLPEGVTDPTDIAMTIWSKNIRMVGVGTMVVGGIWSLIGIMKPIVDSIKASLHAFKNPHLNTMDTPRTEKDIPIIHVFTGTVVLAIPIFLLFWNLLGAEQFPISSPIFVGTVVLSVLISVILGFACSAIAGYMAGLVGSSSCPLSGVTLLAVLLSALSMWLIMGGDVNFQTETKLALSAAAMSIIVGAIVAAAASLGADVLQDLKTGQIVGATPWKQQVMLLVGVLASGLVMAPVLQVLYEAYGLGTTFPRLGMDPTQALMAPKAAIMAVVSESIFKQSLDWTMFLVGVVVAFGVILFDNYLKARNSSWRCSVMAVALGIYMPLDITTAFLFGGLVAFLATKKIKSKEKSLGSEFKAKSHKAGQMGLLFASGLIAGDALLGITLAIPFSIYQSTEIFKFSLGSYAWMGQWLGAGAFFFLCSQLYRSASCTK